MLPSSISEGIGGKVVVAPISAPRVEEMVTVGLHPPLKTVVGNSCLEAIACTHDSLIVPVRCICPVDPDLECPQIIHSTQS